MASPFTSGVERSSQLQRHARCEVQMEQEAPASRTSDGQTVRSKCEIAILQDSPKSYITCKRPGTQRVLPFLPFPLLRTRCLLHRIFVRKDRTNTTKRIAWCTLRSCIIFWGGSDISHGKLFMHQHLGCIHELNPIGIYASSLRP